MALPLEATTSGQPETDPPVHFDEVRLQGATFDFDGFSLGPVDLRLVPGQITFITGDNGSGKSTLGLLLTGLYSPASGTVYLDGAPVDDPGRDRYRQLFSSVFFDYHLFDRVWHPPSPPEGYAPRLRRWLERLGLADKVQFEGATPSTTELSHGQRRRLALALALIEDRPILVFDEYGADQSAEAKRWFYEELLPELRGRGKAIVVITHDDRYFDLADQRLSLDGGRVVALSNGSG